jgi:transcriptional regulator with XRE-family HTH domain
MFAYRYIMLVVRTPAVTGAWLAARRRELGLTQSEAGQRAGITRQSVSRIERGNNRTEYLHILKLIDALGAELRIAISEPSASSGTESLIDLVLGDG